MASQLTSIIDAVVALSITGYSMPVLRGVTLKDQVDDADIPTRIVNALGILFAVAVSIAGGALLYREVESRPGVLGMNLTTTLLVMGILATLAIEAFTR